VPLRVAALLALAPSVVAVAAIVAAELRDWRSKKHEREMRLRDERIEAYRKMLTASTTAHTDREAVDELYGAYVEISLLASTDEIDQAAHKVWVTYDRAQRILAKARNKERAMKNPASFERQRLKSAEAARDRFLALARKELGIKDGTAGFRDLEGDDPGEELPEPQEPSSPQP